MPPRKTRRRCGGAACIAVGILTLAGGFLTLGSARAAEWESPDSIREAARELALRSLSGSSAVQVDAVGVDERLRLPACGEPLEAAIEQAFTSGRGTVAVSCATPQPWRLFVPVRTSRSVPVVVLRRGVRRGQVLTADDVALETRSSAALPYDYLLELDDAVGLTAKRTVPAGTVLVPAALERARLIERGAIVTLVSAAGPVQVKSQGIAVEPAGADQRIRVRTASGRIVEGTVTANGDVRVGGS